MGRSSSEGERNQRRNKKRQSKRDPPSEEELIQLRRQLAQLGRSLIEVDSDGNCLFHSILVGINGNDQALDALVSFRQGRVSANDLRQIAVDYMRAHEDKFSPFLEEAFEEYCCEMEEDGSWGGHLELQALCDALKIRIRIHQPGNPPYLMQSQVEASECDSDSDSDSYLDDHSDRSSDVAARVPESSEDDSNEKSDSDGGKIPQPIVEVALLNEHYSGVLVEKRPTEWEKKRKGQRQRKV